MRPRCLIDLLQHCRSHAVNLKHQKIGLDDIHEGEESYSTDLVANINFEIRDIHPFAADILYAFICSKPYVKQDELDYYLEKADVTDPKQQSTVTDLLLWYGFLGVVCASEENLYIYNVKYDMRRLKAHIALSYPDKPVFHINPAFWAGLDIVYIQ